MQAAHTESREARIRLRFHLRSLPCCYAKDATRRPMLGRGADDDVVAAAGLSVGRIAGTDFAMAPGDFITATLTSGESSSFSILPCVDVGATAPR